MSHHTVPVTRAAELLGVSPATLYRAANHGTAPVPVLKTGGRYTVPVAHLLRALGLTELPPDTSTSDTEDTPPLDAA